MTALVDEGAHDGRARAIGSRTLCSLMVLLVMAAWRAPCGAGDLFRDDFSRFPPGWLTRPVGQLNAAIQEYHYLPHRGVPLGPWANAICHLDAWAVGEEDGKALPRAAHGQRPVAA